MFTVYCEKNKAWTTNKESITVASAGLQVKFTYSDDWEGLSKFAVFKSYTTLSTVPITATDIVDIPASALTKAAVKLYVGVYGVNSSGTIVIPTVFTELGTVCDSALMSDAINYDVPDEALSAQILKLAIDAQYAASIAISGVGASTLTFSINNEGKLVETRTDADDEDLTYDTVIGPVTAYAQAKAAGYTGTLAEFNAMTTANSSLDQKYSTALAQMASIYTIATNAKTAADNAQAAAGQVTTLSQTVSALSTTVSGKQAQHLTRTVTLDASSTKSWTKTCSGVTADNTVIVQPAPASFTAWSNAQIYCSGQSTDSLTFTSAATTTEAITVNVLILP